jgi:hypothetical protein
MSVFIRLIDNGDLAGGLADAVQCFRNDIKNARIFDISVDKFNKIPGAPFAYWTGNSAIRAFERFRPVQIEPERKACFGLSTKDDMRFLRLSWECRRLGEPQRWFPLVKGGEFSRYYFDPHLVIDWENDGRRLKAFAQHRTAQIFGVGSWSRWINNWDTYFRPGIFWSRRSQRGLSFRFLPSGCIYTDKAPVIFLPREERLWTAALLNSKAFSSLVDLHTSFGSYEVGAIQRSPLPEPTEEHRSRLSQLVRRAWSLMRTLDTSNETSNTFLLPSALRFRLGDFDPKSLKAEYQDIQTHIEEIAFDPT